MNLNEIDYKQTVKSEIQTMLANESIESIGKYAELTRNRLQEVKRAVIDLRLECPTISLESKKEILERTNLIVNIYSHEMQIVHNILRERKRNS